MKFYIRFGTLEDHYTSLYDVLYSYQALKAHGAPAENIILMEWTGDTYEAFDGEEKIASMKKLFATYDDATV